MAQETIPVQGLGTSAAPLTYRVAVGDEFDLMAAFASFDGSGAGGSWVPALQVLAPSGAVMVSTIGSTVAAGGTADVTFAPFLEAAVTATGGGVLAWGALAGNHTISVPAYPDPAYTGNWDFSTGTTFKQDGSGIFAYNSAGNPNYLTATLPSPSRPSVLVVRWSLSSHSDPTVYPFARATAQLDVPYWFPAGTKPTDSVPGQANVRAIPAPAGIPATRFWGMELCIETGNDPSFFAGIAYQNVDNAGGHALDLRGGGVWAALIEI